MYKKKKVTLVIDEINKGQLVVHDKANRNFIVKIINGLNEDDFKVGGKVSCLPVSSSNDSVYYVLDKVPFLKARYKVGEIYEFRVGALKDGITPGKAYYPLSGELGVTIPFPFHGEHLPEGTTQKFRLLSYDEEKNKFFVEYVPSEQTEKKEDFPGYEEINEVVPAPKGYSLETLRQREDAGRVLTKIEQTLEDWLPSYIDYLLRLLKNNLSQDKSVESNTLIEYIKSLTKYILEGSSYLKAFDDNRRNQLRTHFEQIYSRLDNMREAVSVMEKNKVGEYVQELLMKFRMAGYVIDCKNRMEVLDFILSFNTKLLDDSLLLTDLVSILESLSEEEENLSLVKPLMKILEEQAVELRSAIDALENSLTQEESERKKRTYSYVCGALWILNDRVPANPDSPLVGLMVTFLRYLSDLCPYYAVHLLGTAVRLSGSDHLPRVAFHWLDLKGMEKSGPDMLASKITKFTRVEFPDNYAPIYYTARGSLKCDKGSYSLIPASKGLYKINSYNYVSCLPMMEGAFSFSVKRNERIAQSETGTIEGVRSFLLSVERTCATVSIVPRTLRQYEDGAWMSVCVRNVVLDDDRPHLVVETIDSSYEKRTGWVLLDEIYFYHIRDWNGVFSVNQVFRVELKGYDDTLGVYHFNLTPPLCDYLSEAVKPGDETDALFIMRNAQRYTFISEDGYSLFLPSNMMEDVELDNGDCVRLRVTNISQNNLIYGQYIDKVYTHFNKEEAMRSLIGNYIEDEDGALPDENMDRELSRQDVTELARCMMAYSRQVTDAISRYTLMASARLVAKLSGDETLTSYIETRTGFLLNLIYFLKNEYGMITVCDIPKNLAGNKELAERQRVQRVIMAFGKEAKNKDIEETLRSQSEGKEAEIARLVLSANLLKGIMPDSYIHALKNEIASRLSVSVDEELELDEGESLGMESEVLEFKTSYVFPAGNHMQPDLERQKMVIMESLDAFLNARGGSLLLGVNDYGIITGVKSDLEELRCTPDQYQNMIRNDIVQYLGVSSSGLISTNFTYGNQVLEIVVKPSEYIVRCNNVAWQRHGNSKRMLTGSALRIAEERKEREHGSLLEKNNQQN